MFAVVFCCVCKYDSNALSIGGAAIIETNLQVHFRFIKHKKADYSYREVNTMYLIDAL